MPLYDYRCPRGHVTEAIQKMDRFLIACSVCSSPAHRVAANRVAVTLPEIDMRGKFRRYEEAVHEADHSAQKVAASTGQAPLPPPYWRMAKEISDTMIARGESPAMHKEQMK